MKDTLCIGGGHSHHQFGVNLVGFHAIIFTVKGSFDIEACSQAISQLCLISFFVIIHAVTSWYLDNSGIVGT